MKNNSTLKNVKKIVMLTVAFVTLTLCAFSANAEEANAQNVTVTVGHHRAQGYGVDSVSVYNSGKYTKGLAQTVNINGRGRVLINYSIRVRYWWGSFGYINGAEWRWVDSSTRSIYL